MRHPAKNAAHVKQRVSRGARGSELADLRCQLWVPKRKVSLLLTCQHLGSACTSAQSVSTSHFSPLNQHQSWPQPESQRTAKGACMSPYISEKPRRAHRPTIKRTFSTVNIVQFCIASH